MADLSIYAGRWVGLSENGQVVGVGQSPEAAHSAARHARPKEHVRLAWVSPHPPHVALPAWPLREIRAALSDVQPGVQLWLAGGPVRDLLLSRPLHDWDFAVAEGGIALARRVADALGASFYPLDKERDTGRVVIADPASQRLLTLDFAALRGAAIEDDLRRRDFTINALALTLEGRLLDPTGGQADLEARLIRLTHPGSFHDDPVRLLRAVRQANALDFQLEPATARALCAHSAAIHTVAAERVWAELHHLLRTPPASRGLQTLHETGLLCHILPEIHALTAIRQSQPHHYADVWRHTLATIAAMEGLLALLRGHARPPHIEQYVRAPAWAWTTLQTALAPHQTALLNLLATEVNVDLSQADLLKWGALFHDVGKPTTSSVDADGRIHFYDHARVGVELTQARLEALHVPHKALHYVLSLVEEHMSLIHLSRTPPTRRAIYRFYRRAGEAGVGVLLLALADCLGVWGPQLERRYWEQQLATVGTLFTAYFERPEEVVAPPPLLSGHDLLALGLPAGPEIGRLLEQVREAQAGGEITTREMALEFARASIADAR